MIVEGHVVNPLLGRSHDEFIAEILAASRSHGKAWAGQTSKTSPLFKMYSKFSWGFKSDNKSSLLQKIALAY